ncbi:MAG: alpha/beta hydrolase [Rhodobacteraceae bacterium]|nr:alpha/beta hydrolase [Paracoccaceae bacterium]MBR9820873.1 alpha/beta hydrolase [Paracoccaceae bacterium]
MPATRHDITFNNGNTQLAGHLWRPDDSDSGAPRAAVVLATPGSSVKEQIGANYARRLTERGFVTLTFDPSFQGQSGGEPRDQEIPSVRTEDIRCAVDHLTTLPFVDAERLGLLGICAGGGYAVAAASTEYRVKALATVVPVNIGRARRAAGREAIHDMLEAVGAQRTAEARGAGQKREPWIPDSLEEAHAAGITDRDVLDAVEFYRTPRGYNEHSTNRYYYTSLAPMIGFDAFHLVPDLLVQPLQVIVGGRKGTTPSYDDGEALFAMAPASHDFHVVEGAGHYDMYDKPPFIDEAVDKLDRFFSRFLAAPAEAE